MAAKAGADASSSRTSGTMVPRDCQHLLVSPFHLGQRLMGICGFREADRRGGGCWWFCFGLGEVSKGNLLAWIVGIFLPGCYSVYVVFLIRSDPTELCLNPVWFTYTPRIALMFLSIASASRPSPCCSPVVSKVPLGPTPSSIGKIPSFRYPASFRSQRTL